MQKPALQQTIAERILQRLSFIKIKPTRILDITAVDSCLAEGLQAAYPEAEKIFAQPEELTSLDSGFDLVVCNLALLQDLQACFQTVLQLLNKDGIFIFTQLGVDSFKEIRKEEVVFPDMHNIGDALLQLGFQDPVMDMENIMFTYDDPIKIIPDMQGTGYERLLGEHHGQTLDNGLYPVTLEIIYGLAYKPAKQVQHHHDNEVRISIDEITKRR